MSGKSKPKKLEYVRQLEIVKAFDNSNDPVSFLDRQFKYLYVNKSYSDYFDQPIGQIVGKTPCDFIQKEFYFEIIKPNLEKALQGTMVSYQEWIDFPKIGRRYMSVQYSPQYGYSDEAIGILHVSRDITYQKNKEEDKIRENQALKAIIRALPGAVSVVDKDFRIIETNKIKHINSLSDVNAAYGKKCFEVFHNKKEPCPWCRLEEVLSTGEAVSEITEQGDPREAITGKAWKVFLEPIKNDQGKTIGIIEYGMDITELKNAREAALDASRAKSFFLANMSHEIRTPINGVMGMVQLLQQTNLTNEQYKLTDFAMKSTKRLSRLLSDILDLARVEAGTLGLEPQYTNFIELLKEIEHLFRPVAQRKKLNLKFKIDQNLPTIISTDSLRLHQVLSNLLGNAIKYSDRGTICLDVELIKSSDEMAHILFAVSDEGSGIPVESISSLFEPFQQATGNYEKKQEGAGLGLAITKQVVELMDGSLCVESVEGAGTTVYFALQFETAVIEPRRKLQKNKKKLRLKCLIAEDDRISQIYLQKSLEKMGHLTFCVDNGEMVLSEISKNDYDIIFMDIQMPVLNGFETTKRIRSGQAGNKNKGIKIIALTAYAMKGDRELFFESGINEYISKPFEIDILESTLRNF